MSILVIAEKPSVGVAIASVLGATQRNDGCMEGGGYVVSWCFGHIGEFASADAYNEKYARWRKEDLPIFPEAWEYRASRDKFTQFGILRKLMRQDDVTEVVNACDAGREGERIFRSAYNLAGCKKPVKRLWISSMEDEAIRDGFRHLRPGSDFDCLYAAADCRAKADWLIGINATRLFSVLYHRTLNVGRVVSPTLAMIVQREAEISAFQPKPFYTVELDCGGVLAASQRHDTQPDAEKTMLCCTGVPAVVREVTHKEKSEKAPALYDLTTLQRDANRLLGYTAQQTLDYVQALYERKLCTYPRTDARYLTDDMEAKVPDLTAVAAGLVGADVPAVVFAGQVCNSAKVSDHHAIVPTISAATADKGDLPTGEYEILLLIAWQVLRAVSDAHRYRETTVALDCGGVAFTVKGKTILVPGWKAYGKDPVEGTILPEYAEGQEIPVDAVGIKKGKISPPKHFTEDSLLSAMENAGEKDMPEDAERKGLGTPATRAAIIEKLVSTGFVERKAAKKSVHLIPVQTGISLITVLPEQLQSPLLTAEWEHKLQQVERGELAAEDFLAGIRELVEDLVQNYKAVPGSEILFPSGRAVVGKCPRCGADVTESKKGFFCERNECRFGIWRDNKFLAGKKVNLTRKMVGALLADGRVPVTGLYSEKADKYYDADLVLEDNGEKTFFRLDFERR